jgi:DNA-binding NtrC family response regulator
MSQTNTDEIDRDELISDPEILVVDDEQEITDLNRYRIEELGYKVKTAFGGREALEKISTNTDVVLLDRRMPKMHGDAVLEEIHDIGYNCQVVMVTAVDPSMEIAEMKFDDYISKPIGRDTIVEVTEEQLNVKQLNVVTNEIISIESKIEVLEDNHPKSTLEDKEEYQQLRKRLKQYNKKKDTLERKLTG